MSKAPVRACGKSATVAQTKRASSPHSRARDRARLMARSEKSMPVTLAKPLEITLKSPPIVPPPTRIAGAEPLADITLAMLLGAPAVAPTEPFCITTPPWADTA